MNRKKLLAVSSVSLAIAAVTPFAIFDPREARAQNAPFHVLSTAEVATIETLAEAIVPGARAAGVSHYIDHELAGPSPRLLLRFAQLPGPMPPYYHAALAAFAASLEAQAQGAFGSLGPDAQNGVVEALRTGSIQHWSPDAVAAPVFYGMMRNDGVDVVYGSADGFKHLEMPYMPHIMPKTTW
jgi:hypothetical protein